MEISGRIARQILLLSLVVLIAPLVAFPELLGTRLVKTSLLNVAYELVFYGLVLFLYDRKVSLFQLTQSAGICLIYRFALGAIFGLLVAAIYPMKLSVAITLGMSSYLPARFLHMAAAPFILRPAVKRQYRGEPGARRTASSERLSPETRDTGVSIAITRERRHSRAKAQKLPTPEPVAVETVRPSASRPVTSTDADGFERATRYIGEDGSVLLAAVIDREGLLLSNFTRGDIAAEDWAPFSLSLLEKNRDVLARIGCDVPEKVDMLFRDRRIIIASEGSFSLMVVSERAVDDVLNIRINQGLDAVRKYVEGRYGDKLIGNAESIHVSST